VSRCKINADLLSCPLLFFCVVKVAPDDVIDAIEEIEEVQSCDLDSVNILA
jgi:hypothetical protein